MTRASGQVEKGSGVVSGGGGGGKKRILWTSDWKNRIFLVVKDWLVMTAARERRSAAESSSAGAGLAESRLADWVKKTGVPNNGLEPCCLIDDNGGRVPGFCL